MPRTPSMIACHAVINTPEQKGITKENLEALLRNISTIVYFAFGFHTAPTTGTLHIHLFIRFKNSTTFSRVKKLLPDGTHIEPAKGSAAQNIDYIINSGPHKDKDTYVKDSLVQSAPEPPDDSMRKMSSQDVMQALEAGETPRKILRKNPALLKFNRISDFHEMEAMLLQDQFGTQMRDMEVAYVQGPTPTGKTYGIYQTFGIENVYRAMMGLPHPFDNYNGHDVILFDEFRENIPLSLMLMYLDKYPCVLGARYGNRIAAYTKAFVVSNWAFEKQYTHEKTKIPEDYKAWVARFSYIRVYIGYCTYKDYTTDNYIKLIRGETVKPLRFVKPKLIIPDVIITPPPAPRLLLPPHRADNPSKEGDT